MATKPRKTLRSNPLDAISDASLVKAKASVSPRVASAGVPDATAVTEKTAQTLTPSVVIAKKTVKKPAVKKTVVKKTPIKKPAASKPEAISPTVVASSAVTEGGSASNEPASTHSDAHTRMSSLDILNEVSAADASQPRTSEDIFDAELAWTRSGTKKETETANPQALAIVKSWSQWSVVGSFIPVPFVDTIAISGAQIKMIHSLCQFYGVRFQRERALAVVSGLLGGVTTTAIASAATKAVVKSMPVVGSLFSLTAEPALSFATTYGIGYAFVKHFESKGTLVDFNVSQMKYYVDQQIAKGKELFKKKKSLVAA